MKSDYPPQVDVKADVSEQHVFAKLGLMHRSKLHRYSITSSARASSVGGIVMSSGQTRPL
jgi:hypothetical protein